MPRSVETLGPGVNTLGRIPDQLWCGYSLRHTKTQTTIPSPSQPKMDTMAEPSTMPRPSQPSDEEVRCYYIGLPGKPRLVARSSTEPWRHQISYGGWNIGKTLDPVNQHPIVALWNDSAGPLRQEFLEALDLNGIRWVAVDILRLGYQRVIGTLDEMPLNPVTALVSVEPNTTTRAAGIDAVLKCRGILLRHGIHDVEVEMKESQISRCNLEAQPNPPSEPLATFCSHQRSARADPHPVRNAVETGP